MLALTCACEGGRGAAVCLGTCVCLLLVASVQLLTAPDGRRVAHGLESAARGSLVAVPQSQRGIAWAIAEFLHEHPAKAKVLFATHYHELNEMTHDFPRIKNFNVSVKELEEKVLFLRKLVPGGSAHSFGIHVAKMAGMPEFVIRRASQKLKGLEKSHTVETNAESLKAGKDEMQLSFFNLDDPLLETLREELKDLDIDTLTPIEALMKLNELKRQLKQ